MTAVVKWNRSCDGYCFSKCSRYTIKPNFNSCVNPTDYDLVYFGSSSLGRKVIARMEPTQKRCKEIAEDHAAGQTQTA